MTEPTDGHNDNAGKVSESAPENASEDAPVDAPEGAQAAAPLSPLFVWSRRILFALCSLGILAVAFHTRFADLGTSTVNHDSMTDLMQTQAGFWGIPRQICEQINPSCPVGFWFLWASTKAFGFTEFGAIFPSALANFLTAGLLILLGAMAGSRMAGLFAAALWVLSTVSIYWANESRWWLTAPLFCVLLAVTSLWLARRPSPWRLGAHLALCLISLYVHAHSAIVIAALWFPPLIAALAAQRGRAWRDRPFLWLTVGYAACALLFLPWLLWVRQFPLSGDFFGRRDDWAYLREVLHELWGNTLSADFRLALGVMAFGTAAAFVFSWRLALTNLILVAATPILISELNEMSAAAFSSRHLVFTLPFAFLTAGYGLAALAAWPWIVLRPHLPPLARGAACAGLFAALCFALWRHSGERLWQVIDANLAGRTWKRDLVEELHEVAGERRPIILMDRINIGSELHRHLTLFGSEFRSDRMLPAWYLAHPLGASFFRRLNLTNSVWVINAPAWCHSPRLRHVGNHIHVADPPLEDMEEFARVTVDTYDLIERHSRAVSNFGHIGGRDGWFEAWILWHTEQREEAQDLMLQTAAANPRNFDAQMGVAHLFRDRDLETAIEHARRAAEMTGRSDFRSVLEELENQRLRDNARPMLARLRDSGDWRALADTARSILEAVPDDPTALGALLQAARELDDDEMAITPLTIAVCNASAAAAPEVFEGAQRFLAERMGLSLLDALVWGEASAWQSHLVAGWLQREGQIEQALQAWDRALTLEDHVEFHMGRHRCLIRIGRYQEALEAAEEARRADPQHLWPLMYIGDSQYVLGSPDQARASWESVLESPDMGGAHGTARQRLENLAAAQAQQQP